MISLMPDLFEQGRKNIFFFEEEIGSIKPVAAGILSVPSGVVQGCVCASEAEAIEHLLEQRNSSVKAKVRATVSRNQTSLF